MFHPTSRYATVVAVMVIAATCAVITVIHVNHSPNVHAHANLLNSSPSASEELDTPPERVIIWFTEPVVPIFSAISVLDVTGAEMTVGDVVFDETEPTAMWIQLGDIQVGTYTVVWRNVSSVDGHKATGAFLFAYGEPLGSETQLDGTEQPLLNTPFDPFIRWAIYLGIAVFAGGLAFEFFITTRTIDSLYGNQPSIDIAIRISRTFARLAYVAIIIVIVAQLGQLWQQAVSGFDIGWTDLNFSYLVQAATQGEWGTYWSIRFAVAILAAMALFMAHQTQKRSENSTPATHPEVSLDDSDEYDDDESKLLAGNVWAVLGLASAATYLVLISLSSHSATVPGDIRWIAIASDIIHIVAASTWVGGLAYLANAAFTSLRTTSGSESRALITQMAIRFTPIAILSATVLIASGIISAVMQVTIAEAIASPYGRALLLKIALLIPLIAIALYNMFSVSRRLATTRNSATKTLSRTVLAESVIACLLLLAVGWLASLEPARQYAERTGIGTQDSVTHNEQIDGAYIDVELKPGIVGNNRLTVTLKDSDGTPFIASDEVRARIKYLDGDFGEPYLPLSKATDGTWQQEQIPINIAGAYQVEINIVRSDAFDSRTSFRFSARSTSFASDIILPSSSTSVQLFGLQLLLIGAGLFASGIRWQKAINSKLRRHMMPRRNFAIIGGTCMLIGMLVAVNATTLGVGVTQEAERNPFPLNQDSIDLGSSTYTTTCTTCHGESGKGDGPAAVALNPSPADLAIHIPLHTDAELFDFIANGIDGTPMIPQLGNLSEDEIWHLVNFIRTFEE